VRLLESWCSRAELVCRVLPCASLLALCGVGRQREDEMSEARAIGVGMVAKAARQGRRSPGGFMVGVS
jgi:hypothetical protein